MNAASETDDSGVSDVVEGYFRATWPVDAEHADDFDADRWRSTAELGLHLVNIPEEHAGSGGSLSDLATIARLAGRYAVPLPLVETHLAAWLLSRSGREVTDPLAAMSIARPDHRDSLAITEGLANGVLHDVPWGSSVSLVVAVHDDDDRSVIVLIDPAACRVEHGQDLAGQPKDRLILVDSPVTVVATTTSSHDLLLRGALLTSAQMAGAMESTAELTQAYVGQREQFGRPIGAFQAVQHHVVELTQMAVMTRAMIDRLVQESPTGPASFEVCATKLVADENAAHAVRAAHQAHGAIGMTQEYRLQRLSRRLNEWRATFGGELDLADRLGGVASCVPSLAQLVLDDNSRPEV